MAKAIVKDTDSLEDAVIEFLALREVYMKSRITKEKLSAAYGRLIVELSTFEVENEIEIPEAFDETIKQIKTPRIA